ncbi:MAG TPA: hypothetical protein VGK01_00765 [Candidatus Angelobacter sp.]|jgi:hypothetical protein
MNSLTFDTVTPIPKGSKEEIQFIPRISPLTQVLPGDSQITGATRNYDDVTLLRLNDAGHNSASRKPTQGHPEFGNIVPGVFTPVLAKHTKSFNLVDTLSVGVDRIQRNFEPLQRQVETWRQTQITDDTAKLILYSAFIDGKLEAPRSLLSEVHRLYFEPQYAEFSTRTMWSLSNAFTSAFKKLDPVPQLKATAKRANF